MDFSGGPAMSEAFSPLAGFGGVVRLFPLPNFVFFPHAMQPLHIFEPRYRQMSADALAGDRLIAMVLPKPGWEKDHAAAPSLYSVATVGQIIADNKLEDGRYHLLLRGLSRIHLVEELPHNKLYRKARAELLVEVPLESGLQEGRLRKRLLKAATPWFPGQDALRDEFRKLLESELPLGVLCDLIAFALPLEVEFKQSLLEELEVGRRSLRLLDHLATGKQQQPADTHFPPEFSVN
jgi:Lon protease-like protein